MNRWMAMFAAAVIGVSPVIAEEHCHTMAKAPVTASQERQVPDVEVVDQHGKRLRLRSDLIENRVVAINFIFTTCTTICPALAVTFTKLQDKLGGRLGRDVSLISVSIDPANDTPERLAEWGRSFGAREGWTLITGKPSDIESLLKALGVYTARIQDHPAATLIGNGNGDWQRLNGFPSPAHLISAIDAAVASRRSASARNYFTDVPLVNQSGTEMRLYSDLLQGKVVVINSFFTRCTTACPVMNRTFARLQESFSDRVGKDLFLLSISVDPEYDTPERLREYASHFKARPGWIFLTGAKENVGRALTKLGQSTAGRESHQTLFIVGNEPKGLWKKAFGLADSTDIIAIVRGVLDDPGVSSN